MKFYIFKIALLNLKTPFRKKKKWDLEFQSMYRNHSCEEKLTKMIHRFLLTI